MRPVSSSPAPPTRPDRRPGAPAAAAARLDGWLRARRRQVDAGLAVLLAAALGPFTVLALPADRPGWVAAQLGCAAAVHVALAFRRGAPAVSFGVASVALAVSELLPGLSRETPFLPSAIAYPVALYSFCAYGGRRAPLLGALVGTAGAVLISGRAVAEAGPGTRSEAETLLNSALLLGFLLAVVVASWSLGVFRTVRSVYLAALEERARLAEAEREDRVRRAARDERARIAREMHDVVAHSLSVIVSQAQGGAYVAADQPERAARALDTIAETGREALADMRGLLGVLRADPDAPDTEAAPADPQPSLADLPDLVARVRDAGLSVSLAETGAPRRLGAATGLAAYRLVQESLTNTLKHAGPAARAEVRLEWTQEELVVEVTDDGDGPGADNGGGQGLVGMRERVTVVGGVAEAGPRPGGGFAVAARFPVSTGGRP